MATRGSIVLAKAGGATFPAGFLDGHSVGRSAWAFSIDAGGERTSGTFALTCLHSDPVETLLVKDSAKTAEIGPDSTVSTTIRCPAGYAPAGATFDHRRTDASFGGLTPPPLVWLTVSTMRATARGWQFVAQAHGGATWRARYRLRCVRLATGSVNALMTRSVKRSVEVPAETSRGLTLRCAPGWLPAFPGWSGYDGVQRDAVRARLGDMKVRYVISNRSTESTSVVLDLLCVRARARPTR